MKKRVLVLVAIMAIAVSSLAAVELDLSLGGQMTYGQINISHNGGGSPFDFAIDAELDMDFSRGHGMLLGVLVQTSTISLNVGYAYQTDISSSCDFILGAGATLVIKNPVELNYFVTADFDFNITQDMFVRVGTGVMLNLGALNSDYGRNWDIVIPLPALAFGWHF